MCNLSHPRQKKVFMSCMITDRASRFSVSLIRARFYYNGEIKILAADIQYIVIITWSSAFRVSSSYHFVISLTKNVSESLFVNKWAFQGCPGFHKFANISSLFPLIQRIWLVLLASNSELVYVYRIQWSWWDKSSICWLQGYFIFGSYFEFRRGSMPTKRKIPNSGFVTA